MKIIYLFCLIFCINPIFGLILEVNPNHPTSFQSISEAIVSAVFHDTLLIYPGTYQENINLSAKDLYLSSLYLFNPDTSYIHNTIIDGGNLDPCVKIILGETATLNGLTLTRGKGTFQNPGGGIYIKNSYVTLSNCIMKNNYSYNGGGIGAKNSTLYLVNNEIFNNQAIRGGGLTANNCTVYFSQSEKNSIYNNHASSVSDIHLFNNMQIQPLIELKKFTIDNPDQYFIHPVDSLHITAEEYTEQAVFNDMYVSAEGDDQNDGLSPETPLRSLHLALRRIKAPDNETKTLHIKNGIYTANTQLFPLQVKHNIIIEGESRDSTIFDGLNKRPFFIGYQQTELNFTLRNIWFKRAFEHNYHDALYFRYMTGQFDNIRVSDCNQESMNPIFLYYGSYKFNQVIVENNRGGKSISGAWLDNFELKNSVIRNNRNYNADEWMGEGGGIQILGFWTHHNKRTKVLIDNVLFENNRNIFTGIDGGVSALSLNNALDATVINCTFKGNISSNGVTVSLSGSDGDGNLSIKNSIFYDNVPNNRNISAWADTIEVSHCLLQNGTNSLVPVDDGRFILGEGNLDADPLFIQTGSYPYRLHPESPCIDAGTQDIPGYEFPLYDQSGQPRVYGVGVDMGAFEWNPFISNTDQTEIPSSNLRCYPNPFNPSTTISWDMPTPGQVEISVYNLKGQKVQTLTNQQYSKGKYQIVWNGKNSLQQSVSSGIYFIRLKQNEKNQTRKVILVK